MIIDMHVHTTLGSICSQLDPDELLEKASKLGIDAVCVTDHHSHRGADRMIAYAQGSGYLILRGVEIYTELGDMLVFGLKRETRYHLTTFEELVEMAEADQAVIIPSHPCRGWDSKHRQADVFPEEMIGHIVAIETHNGANTERSNRCAQDIAEEFTLPGTCGSDAHASWQVGKCVTIFDRDIHNLEELIFELREGRYTAVYLNELRERE